MARVLGKHALIPHPELPAPPVRLATKLTHVGSDVLRIEYVVTGEVGRLAIPKSDVAARRDELWRHTCFELFLRDTGSARYHEFNFAPSGEWACYRFDAYREGMREAPLPEPALYWQAGADRLALDAWVDLRSLGPGAMKAALTAVIEEADGTTSYWSLAHPNGKPDFHHPDCFVLELPARSAS